MDYYEKHNNLLREIKYALDERIRVWTFGYEQNSIRQIVERLDQCLHMQQVKRSF